MSKIITPKFRVSFPQLDVPKAFGNGKPKYGITMLIPKKEDITGLREAIKAVVLEKWPDAAKRPKNLHNPIKDGDTDLKQDGTLRKESSPEAAGMWVIRASASAKSQPKCVDTNPNIEIAPEEIYAGSYARASINPYAYAPTKLNPEIKSGVALGLNNVQRMGDGEPFGRPNKPEDDFSEVQASDFGNDPDVAGAKPAEDSMFAQ